LSDPSQSGKEVDQFVLSEIESVPHLEALLLLWNTRPKTWTIREVGERLYVPPALAGHLLRGLWERRLITGTIAEGEEYGYDSSSEERNRLVAELDHTYRREVVRISNLIHSRPASSLRDFAQAFRFTKDKQ